MFFFSNLLIVLLITAVLYMAGYKWFMHRVPKSRRNDSIKCKIMKMTEPARNDSIKCKIMKTTEPARNDSIKCKIMKTTEPTSGSVL